MLTRSSVFAAVLLVVAVALGGLAYRMYFEASDEPDRPSFEGVIAVVTNGENDKVEMTVSEPSEAGAASGSTLTVLVSVNPAPSRDHVRIAVGLDGLAKIGKGQTPPDGELTPRNNNGPGHLEVRGLKPAFFASQATWPAHRDTHESEVLFGVMDECMNDWCTAVMTVPMSRSMLESAGGTWTLSTPRLGAESPDPDFPSERDIHLGSAVDSAAGDELDRLNHTEDWYVPQTPTLTFEAPSDRIDDSVQQSGTSPIEAFGNTWRGREPFAVKAVFEQPRLTAQEGSKQFFAGVLASLAGSFFVWALELLSVAGRSSRRHEDRDEA